MISRTMKSLSVSIFMAKCKILSFMEFHFQTQTICMHLLSQPEMIIVVITTTFLSLLFLCTC